MGFSVGQEVWIGSRYPNRTLHGAGGVGGFWVPQRGAPQDRRSGWVLGTLTGCSTGQEVWVGSRDPNRALHGAGGVGGF